MTGAPLVRRDHQVLVIGRKGSGKSIGVRFLVSGIRGRLVVLNVKNDPGLSAHLARRYEAVRIKGDPKKLHAAIRDHRVVEYVPADALGMAEFDAVYRELVKWTDLSVWLDECYGPTSSSAVARGLAQFLQHGRSRRLRHYGATQRPRHIAKPLLTEADHIVFYPFGFAAEDFNTVAANMALKESELERIVATLDRDRAALGDHACLWYDRTRNVLHRRPSVPIVK
jgi:hypothetical protein